MINTQDWSKVREIGNLEFLAKQLVEGFITGLHRSPFHGFSVEFAEHRLYNTGESTRHIDWKVFAKTDRLYIKEYEEETNLRCQILLDTSSSMFYPQEKNQSNYLGKITFGILGASALAYMLQKQKDAVSLCHFSEEIELHTQCKSTPSHLHKIFSELENLLKIESKQHNKKTLIADTLHIIAEKVHKRSLVIVFSDMLTEQEDFERIFSGLQHLKHNKNEVLLFHVTDKKTEQDFDFQERPYQFIDLETNQKINLVPSQVKEHFKNQQEEYFKNLKLKCAQFKIDLIEADIADGFEQILYAYMIKRNKML
ncbi:MAG: DUF58 domain-containing protein [Bacteroidetes bacterium]|nr:MAG: DUF58 domain-containing protein [Bacteroidota bacterium]